MGSLTTKMFLLAGILLLAGCSDNSELSLEPQTSLDAAIDAVADVAGDAAADVSNEAAVDATKPESGQDAAAEADSDKPKPEDSVCSSVQPDKAAVVFKPPQPRGDGFLAADAWIHYPSYANRPDVKWSDPFPGCVAPFATDQVLLCDFGAAFEGAKIYFITGLNNGTTTGALTGYFSQVQTDGVDYYGEYYACVGTKAVGSFKGAFDGALAPSDEQPVTANLLFTVPAL